MTGTPDPSVFASEVAANLIARVTKSTMVGAGRLTGSALRELQVIYNTCFQPFMAAQYFQYFEIKTLVSPLAPVAIEDIFESPNLSINKNRRRYPKGEGMSLDEFATKVNEKSRVIISAIAGSGKSVLLKYLFIQMIKRGSKFIPIFVELRHLNDLSEPNLETLMYGQILASNKKFKREQFLSALRLGKFCFMLDGFDELRPELRSSIKSQIDDLAQKYPDNAIVLTSRPDDEFLSWPKYTEYYVHPFSKPQVVSLIGKMPFDSKIKSKLISRIKDDLFNTHRDFLSNPLLAGMMLLTFESSYDIPSKRHIFFQRAFQALMEKHDASKGHRRSFSTHLDMNEFAKAFSAFCVYSYLEREYSFSQESAKHYADFAFQVIGHDPLADEFVHDLEKCVCMLVRDGDRLSFLHRSFQEYFAANFIVFHSQGRGAEILDNCIERDGVPNAAAYLCADIDREFVEFEYMLPLLAEFSQDVEAAEGNFIERSKLLFGSISPVRGKAKEDPISGAFDFNCSVLDPNAQPAKYVHMFLLLLAMNVETAAHDRLLPANWIFSLSGRRAGRSQFYETRETKEVVSQIINTLLELKSEIESRRGEKKNLLQLLT